MRSSLKKPKPIKVFTLSLLLNFSLIGLGLQAQSFKLHSHNDYERRVPFWEAYANEVESIEADILLYEGELYVAHETESIRENRTITNLYLDPIRKAFDLNIGSGKSFQLLVDIKTEAYSTLEKLVEVLDSYADLFSKNENASHVTVVISGNRPKPEDYRNYPDHIQFDYQSITETDNLPLDKIELFSLNFRRFSQWNGKGRIVDEEMALLREAIQIAHSFHKPIRFWATPDSKTAWKALKEMGVDFINTDMPFEAKNYLETLDHRIYATNNVSDIYQPTYEMDGLQSQVKNVILLIGDGNGLAQIATALYTNNNQLTLAQIKNIGLIKTQSLDDFTTDSAAAGTALATGSKVKNRSISLHPDGSNAESIPEYLRQYGFYTGIVTTDNITGATPATFYAHQEDRDMILEITGDLVKSNLDLFIGGGKNDFLKYGENNIDKLLASGFHLATSLNEIGQSKVDRIGYFASNHAMPTVLKGRKGFLEKASAEAIQFLSHKENPFFLMIEGAYIDNGGHNNHTATIAEEGIDFDTAIKEALKFADENKETLVVITADHETGGVSLPQGNLEKGMIELDYQSNDHTGILVPVFAYGPHSDLFRGIYENTEVFHKIISVLEKYLD